MAIEYRERVIGGQMYRVTQLGAKAGRGMLVRLLKLLGPGLGSFVGGLARAPGGKDAAEAGLALGVGDALHELAARLTEGDVVWITDAFAAQTVVVRSAEIELRLNDIFDDQFAGRYDEMLAWLGFCLEVNFASFFRGKSAGAAPLAKLWKVLSALQPPPTSTGTSTASPQASATPQA